MSLVGKPTVDLKKRTTDIEVGLKRTYDFVFKGKRKHVRTYVRTKNN